MTVTNQISNLLPDIIPTSSVRHLGHLCSVNTQMSTLSADCIFLLKQLDNIRKIETALDRVLNHAS